MRAHPWLVLVAALEIGSASSASSAPQEMPRIMVMAVGQPGSVLNAVGTGVAKLISEKTTTRMRVRVTPAMDALVGSADADLGVSASDSAHLSSNGLRHYEGRAQTSLRLLLPGPPLLLGFIVRKGSALETVADLRGRKVPGEYPNARPMYYDGHVMLHTAGMTWDDLEVIPVASFRDGIQAFIEGRTAAAISSVASGMTQQADASVEGVRFLSLPRTSHVSETMWQEEPGFHAVSVSAGFAIGIERDMVLAAKDSYLTAHASVSPSTVYAIVKLLWESIHELDSVHPIFKRWTHADMLNPRVTIPFHEGTVRFLKERGKWTPAHEKTQQELLVKLSR